MNSDQILYLIIGILTFDFALEQFLDYRNYKSIGKTLPSIVSDVYEAEKYKKSQRYQKETARFSFLTSTVSFVLYIVVLSFGILGKVDEYLANYIDNNILRGVAFLGLSFIVSDVLTIPFQWYKTFIIEEKYGFNKSTISIFIVDKLKGYFLTALIGGGLISLLLYLIVEIGEHFWLYFWMVAAVFMLLINMFYTSWIVPLFNKLTPLEDGELRSAIENYSKKAKFELTNIFVIDGSKRSNKANAYFSGIGPRKKVVLYDTLINNHTTEELVAVLAHEVGHFKKKHIVWSLIISIFQIGLTLFILSQFIFQPTLSVALGAKGISYHLNLIAFGMLFSPISTIIGLLMNIFSRKNEYEADAFAAETSSASSLQLALKKLSSDNLSNLTPDAAYVFFHHSHPPLIKRLEALKRFST